MWYNKTRRVSERFFNKLFIDWKKLFIKNYERNSTNSQKMHPWWSGYHNSLRNYYGGFESFWVHQKGEMHFCLASLLDDAVRWWCLFFFLIRANENKFVFYAFCYLKFSVISYAVYNGEAIYKKQKTKKSNLQNQVTYDL